MQKPLFETNRSKCLRQVFLALLVVTPTQIMNSGDFGPRKRNCRLDGERFVKPILSSV